MISLRLTASALVALLLASPLGSSHAGATTIERVTPSVADPGVHAFDDPNIVLSTGAANANAPLVVFLPGTGGRSEIAPMALLETIAGLGYRAIYLTYDDEPAGTMVCARRDPSCPARFREMRAYGTGAALVSNPTAEAIVPRLSALLRYLATEHPDAGWDGYLQPSGEPAWPRIVVSGLSQGAGMAAFIAKRSLVERVVLFSSPWDDVGPARRPAPWLSLPSATPPDAWWAERHARENTTALIANAYAALRIPPDHILIFDGPLSPNASAAAKNPYHGSTIRLRQYASQWRTMYGSPPSP